jgi:hypothetical protein
VTKKIKGGYKMFNKKILVLIISLLFTSSAFAHCDTEDGPIIPEIRAALDKGDITPALKWIKKEHEPELTAAFDKALAARSASGEAKELADRYFIETLIRIHRAGEGAPYTGIKPAGTVEPAVAAADKAVEAGSVDKLAHKIGNAAEKAVKERFERLMEARKHKDENVEAGREYVEAYVLYVHFVEGLHNTITKGGAHDAHASEKGAEEHGH